MSVCKKKISIKSFNNNSRDKEPICLNQSCYFTFGQKVQFLGKPILVPASQEVGLLHFMYDLGLSLDELVLGVQARLIIDGAYDGNEKVEHNNDHQDNIHGHDDQAGDALVVSHEVHGIDITLNIKIRIKVILAFTCIYEALV